MEHGHHLFAFYNTERIHQALDYQTPEAVHRAGLALQEAAWAQRETAAFYEETLS